MVEIPLTKSELKQIQSDILAELTTDLSVDHLDLDLGGSTDDGTVQMTAEHLAPVVSGAQMQMGVKFAVHRVDRAGQRDDFKAALERIGVILLLIDLVHADSKAAERTERLHAR